MATLNASRALPPVWFRFTDEQDKGKYGDRWYCYDESVIMRTRGRDLVVLENELGMPLLNAMNGFRDSTALGDLAVTWLGVRALDPARAGDFDEYSPMTNMIEWSSSNPEPEGKGDEPEPTPGPPASTSPMPAPSDSQSQKTATVVLPNLPIAE